MYYSRIVATQLDVLKKGFPVVVATGPRQAGKTTLLREHFPKYEYFNLENPQTLSFIMSDPQGFLSHHPKHIIVDEVQRYPDLLSYIQAHVDERQEMGAIALSGSQNLLIAEKISQSLAGRAAYQNIFPFSQGELIKNNIGMGSVYEQILRGHYPALYTRDITPPAYYSQYLATYVERDVRLIKNIKDLSQFRKFLELLAGRVGQLINISSLAIDTGISPNTALEWLSILEATYIVYRLRPYFKNTGKRLVKSPKVFFYDTGVLCSLLNLSSVSELRQHFVIGGIFENYIVSEFKKYLSETGKSARLYFYRESHGNEVDILVDTGALLLPVEVKSSATFNQSFFDGLATWREYNDTKNGGYVVYGGEDTQKIQQDMLVSWRNLKNIFEKII